MPLCPACAGPLTNPQGSKRWCAAELREVELAAPGTMAWCFQQGAAMESAFEKEHGEPMGPLLVNNSKHMKTPDQMKEIIRKGTEAEAADEEASFEKFAKTQPPDIAKALREGREAAKARGPQKLTDEEFQESLIGHLQAAAGNLKKFCETRIGMRMQLGLNKAVSDMADRCDDFFALGSPYPGSNKYEEVDPDCVDATKVLAMEVARNMHYLTKGSWKSPNDGHMQYSVKKLLSKLGEKQLRPLKAIVDRMVSGTTAPDDEVMLKQFTDLFEGYPEYDPEKAVEKEGQPASKGAEALEVARMLHFASDKCCTPYSYSEKTHISKMGRQLTELLSIEELTGVREGLELYLTGKGKPGDEESIKDLKEGLNELSGAAQPEVKSIDDVPGLLARDLEEDPDEVAADSHPVDSTSAKKAASAMKAAKVLCWFRHGDNPYSSDEPGKVADLIKGWAYQTLDIVHDVVSKLIEAQGSAKKLKKAETIAMLARITVATVHHEGRAVWDAAARVENLAKKLAAENPDAESLSSALFTLQRVAPGGITTLLHKPTEADTALAKKLVPLMKDRE